MQEKIIIIKSEIVNLHCH